MEILNNCKNCMYWDYQDVKKFPNGQFEWGNCHLKIPKNAIGYDDDLLNYFQKKSTDYCSDFEKIKGKK
jgi:hypothetical protein